MSDPANDGYQCHGAMRQVDLLELTGVAMTSGTAVWVCETCGVWRHGYPNTETQLRAIVNARMPAFLEVFMDAVRQRRKRRRT
jgi:hypothetical protein